MHKPCLDPETMSLKDILRTIKLHIDEIVEDIRKLLLFQSMVLACSHLRLYSYSELLTK